MGQLSSSLLVRLIDGISGPARTAADSIKGIGRAMSGINGRSATVNIGRQIAQQTRAISESAARASAAVSAPAVAGAAWGFNQAFQFEKTMNTMEALGEITQAQRLEAEKYLQVLNNKYPQTLTKLGQTMNELLRGGLSFKAAMGAMDQTMALAVFGDIDPKDASEIAVNAMNQFKMPMATVEEAGASMKRVADVIAYAANKSNTDVRNMGLTFKYAAPMATALGMSLEQTAAMAMIMANAGIKGSESGVAMRSAMVRLLRPTKEMMATLGRLGINLDDFKTKGKAITSSDIIGSLQADGIDASRFKGQIDEALNNPELKAAPQRMVAELARIVSEGLGSTSLVDKETLAKNLTDTLTAAGSQIDLIGFIKAVSDKAGPEAANVIARIFDARQGSRLLTLAGADIGKLLEELMKNTAGYADKGAQIMLKGIVGPFYELTAAFESLAVSIAQSGVFKDLAQIFKSIADSIDSLGKANPELLRFSTYSVLALAAVGPLGFVLSGLAASFKMVAAAARLATLLAIAPFALAVRTLGTAAALTMVRVRAMAAGLFMLGSVGGAGAVMGAIAGSVAAFGRALIAFPLVALRGIAAGLVAIVANPVGLAVAAIVIALTALGVWIANNWEGIKAFFSGFGEGFSKGLGPEAGAAVEKISSALGSVVGWLRDLLGPIDETGTKWRSWGEAVGGVAAKGVNMIADAIGKVIGLLGTAIEKAISFGSAIKNAFTFNDFVPMNGGGGAKIPARAGGGDVRRGTTYLVGEEGPELFTASASGTITPNHELASGSRSGGQGGGSSARSASGGRAAPPASVSMSFGNIIVQGVTNAAEVAEQVAEQLDSRVREAMRGLTADLGYTS